MKFLILFVPCIYLLSAVVQSKPSTSSHDIMKQFVNDATNKLFTTIKKLGNSVVVADKLLLDTVTSNGKSPTIGKDVRGIANKLVSDDELVAYQTIKDLNDLETVAINKIIANDPNDPNLQNYKDQGNQFKSAATGIVSEIPSKAAVFIQMYDDLATKLEDDNAKGLDIKVLISDTNAAIEKGNQYTRVEGFGFLQRAGKKLTAFIGNALKLIGGPVAFVTDISKAVGMDVKGVLNFIGTNYGNIIPNVGKFVENVANALVAVISKPVGELVSHAEGPIKKISSFIIHLVKKVLGRLLDILI